MFGPVTVLEFRSLGDVKDFVVSFFVSFYKEVFKLYVFAFDEAKVANFNKADIL